MASRAGSLCRDSTAKAKAAPARPPGLSIAPARPPRLAASAVPVPQPRNRTTFAVKQSHENPPVPRAGRWLRLTPPPRRVAVCAARHRAGQRIRGRGCGVMFVRRVSPYLARGSLLVDRQCCTAISIRDQTPGRGSNRPRGFVLLVPDLRGHFVCRCTSASKNYTSYIRQHRATSARLAGLARKLPPCRA